MKRYPSISPVYNRLNYRSKSGFAPVYLRIYYRGKTDYVLLDRVPSIHKRDWIGDMQQDIYVLNPEINKLIREILFATRDWVQSKVLQGHSISVMEIKEHLQIAKTNETFNDFVDRFIRNINKRKSDAEKLSFRTIQTYRSFEVRLNEFRSEIRLDEVTPSMAHEFERYLAVDCNLRGVTRAKHFDKFKIGLYYSDIRQLTHDNIEEVEIEDKEGQKTVRYITGLRSKNEEEFVIPIFTDTEKILLEYSLWKGKNGKGVLFDSLISDQKFNAKLKSIASQLKIDKRLSAKVARHTFAELMISMGVPVKKVGRALGHQLVSTTEVYGRQSKASAIRGWIDFSL